MRDERERLVRKCLYGYKEMMRAYQDQLYIDPTNLTDEQRADWLRSLRDMSRNLAKWEPVARGYRNELRAMKRARVMEKASAN